MKSNSFKMQILIVKCLFILSLFQQCSSAQDMSNENFIDKYGNENYSNFKNKSLFVRDFENGNPIIFIYDYSKEKKPCGFISMTISSKTKELIKVKEVPQRDNCTLAFNKEEYYKLALKFLEYNINSLDVDTNLNVSVKIKFYEGLPNLIRYSDVKYISDTDNIIKIKGNWYQRTK